MVLDVAVVVRHAAETPLAAADIERALLARDGSVLAALGLGVAVGPAHLVG
jgi:hypothetical protein